MTSKLVLLIAALLAGTSLSDSVQAKGGGAASANSSANGVSGGSNGASATRTRPNPSSIFRNPFQNPITEGIPAAASTSFFNPNVGQFNQNANQTINTGTAPTGGSTPNINQNAGQTTVGSTQTTSPTIGVGHAPNGLPIGSPGSGPGSPEQPIDSGSR
jgi:hypothetical protein